MSKPKRPWLVIGRSHEHEWNARVGRRFATRAAAIAFFNSPATEGWYAMTIRYSPVLS